MKSICFPLFCAAAISVGCSAINSSLNFTKGTDCLVNGDYNQAAAYLEKAVELDPDMGRNHTNLAAAYLALEEKEKAWKESRAAINCKNTNSDDYECFAIMFVQYADGQGLCRPGTSKEVILEKLGTPDREIKTDSIVQYLYGPFIMSFKYDLLNEVTVISNPAFED